MRDIIFVPAEMVIGDRLSERTLARCLAGYSLWLNTGRKDVIICSGGIFLPPDRQKLPASKMMREWFLGRGVPENQVLAEEKSRDSYENVMLSLRLAIKTGLIPAKINVVTQWQHAIRIILTFRYFGQKTSMHEVKYRMSVWEISKELFFILCHFFDPAGKSFIARYNRRRRTFHNVVN